MKIYSDYEKKLRDFEACERNHNRGYKVYFFLSFLGLGFMIYTIINFITAQERETKEIILLATGIMSFLMFLILGLQRLYIFKILPKRKPLFTEIVDTYKKGQILNELQSYDIDKSMLDTVIVPNGYVNIAYIYDKNCYIEGCVERNGFTFTNLVTKNVTSKVEIKIFDKHLKKQYGKSIKFNSKGYDKNKFYTEFINYIKNSNIKDLALRCQEAIDEHKKIYR